MDGNGFLKIIRTAFQPFLLPMGFSAKAPSVNGRFYEATFEGTESVISVAFEPGENYFNVYIFGLEAGRLSDIDDRESTRRLSDLNSRYQHEVTPRERVDNENFFQQVIANDNAEKMLLKGAKDLRLILPLYLRDHASRCE